MHKADEAVNLLNLWCTATHHKSALAPKHPFYSVLEPKVGMYQNEVNCLVRHIVTYVNQVEYNNMYKGVTLCDFLQLLSAIYYTYITVYIYIHCVCVYIYILCMCVYIYYIYWLSNLVVKFSLLYKYSKSWWWESCQLWLFKQNRQVSWCLPPLHLENMFEDV